MFESSRRGGYINKEEYVMANSAKKKRSKQNTATAGTKKKTMALKITATKKNAKPSPQASTRQLKVGQKAPAFSLPNQDGIIVNLSDYKGKKIVLYFYPKDDTPGCTKESCAFRDGIDEIHDIAAEVIGVSADSVESHKKFSKKYNLNFPLLSDESKKMIHSSGVWKEKSLYGRKFMGIERTTFMINENGKIDEIFRKVKSLGTWKRC